MYLKLLIFLPAILIPGGNIYIFPGGTVAKNPSANAGYTGDSGSIRKDSPGEGHGNPLQYLCLGNSMDRGAWQDTVHGVKELDTTEQLNNNSFIKIIIPSEI